MKIIAVIRHPSIEYLWNSAAQHVADIFVHCVAQARYSLSEVVFLKF